METQGENKSMGSLAENKDASEMLVSPGTGQPMQAVEHPADGTMSPPLSNPTFATTGTLAPAADAGFGVDDRSAWDSAAQ